MMAGRSRLRNPTSSNRHREIEESHGIRPSFRRANDSPGTYEHLSRWDRMQQRQSAITNQIFLLISNHGTCNLPFHVGTKAARARSSRAPALGRKAQRSGSKARTGKPAERAASPENQA